VGEGVWGGCVRGKFSFRMGRLTAALYTGDSDLVITLCGGGGVYVCGGVGEVGVWVGGCGWSRRVYVWVWV
jgi:hypothetical protein